MKREAEIKKMPRRQKIELVAAKQIGGLQEGIFPAMFVFKKPRAK
jgi:hypothetical protein